VACHHAEREVLCSEGLPRNILKSIYLPNRNLNVAGQRD
jgi:hypothetical protein